jgi:hypothetical protein
MHQLVNIGVINALILKLNNRIVPTFYDYNWLNKGRKSSGR